MCCKALKTREFFVDKHYINALFNLTLLEVVVGSCTFLWHRSDQQL